MRRVIVTVLATVAALVAVPVAPAHAAVTVIDHLAEITDPYEVVTERCDHSVSLSADARLEPGPSTLAQPDVPADHPPLGTGSLELDTPFNGDVAGVRRTIGDLADLQTFDLWTHDPDGRGQAVITVFVDPSGEVWTGKTALGARSTWGHVTNLMTRNWVWTTPVSGTRPEGGSTTTTIAGFRSSIGTGPAFVAVQRQRCGGRETTTSTTHVDALTITLAREAPQTLDLEEPPVDVGISATPTTVDPGGAVTIDGTLTADGDPLPNRTVSLMQSTNGTDYTQLLAATTDASGAVSAVVSPSTSTWYRWDFVALDYAPARSTSVQVLVREPTQLTMTVDRSTVVSGSSFTASTVLTGSTSGAPLANLPVVLRRSLDGGTTWTDVASATTSASGAASATLTPTASAAYRWHFLGAGAYAPSQSPRQDVAVLSGSTLTATVTPTIVDYGGGASVTGRLTIGGTPAAGQSVELWAWPNGGAWSRQLTMTTNASGDLLATVNPVGTTRYQWRFPQTASAGAATSPVVLLTVRRQVILTNSASATALSPGDTTTISTVLTGDGTPVSGRPVVLERSSDGGATWTTLASRTTDASGAASSAITPTRTALYRWRHDRNPTLSAATSANLTVYVRYPTGLTISAAASSVPAGGSTFLRTDLGSGETPVAGATVTLRASTDGGTTWADIGAQTTDAAGHAELPVSPTSETVYRWRFAPTPDLRGAQSPTTRVVIADPPQATSLANEVDDDTLWLGQHAVVRGTLTVGTTPKQYRRIELWSSTDAGATWTRLLSQATDAQGRVSLDVAPTTTTTYEWRFAGGGSLLASTSPDRTVTVSPLLDSTLDSTADATTVTAGDFPKLTAQLTAGGAPVAGASLTLVKSPPGRGSWTVVARLTTGDDGKTTIFVQQFANMTYRWVYRGSESTTPVTSTDLTILARFRVTAQAAAVPAAPGDRLLVTGRVHRYTGAPLRLYQVTDSGAGTLLGQTSLHTDGTYQLAVVMPTAGTFTLYAEIGPDSQNEQGRSPTFMVTVPS